MNKSSERAIELIRALIERDGFSEKRADIETFEYVTFQLGFRVIDVYDTRTEYNRTTITVSKETDNEYITATFCGIARGFFDGTVIRSTGQAFPVRKYVTNRTVADIVALVAP